MRNLLVALAVVVLLPAGLWAEQVRGQIKSVDASKNMLTLTVNGKDRTIECTPKCQITTTMTQSRRVFPRRSSVQEYLTTLNQLPQGATVMVTTENRDGMEMATMVQANDMMASNSNSTRTGLLRRNR